MKSRTLLFLCAHDLRVYSWRDGVLREEATFSNDQTGHEQCAVLLRAQHAPVMLLADLIEEDFRSETLPHLSGSARRAQQQRKFEQFYRTTRLRQAVLQRRQRTGRRDDEVLFSALTNPQLIMPWLERLQQLQIPLIGVYSVPTVSAPLLQNLPAQHALLLSWEKGAGLRQSYFKERQLCLSRISAVNEHDDLPNAIAAETRRTLQYLHSLSLLPPEQVLHTGIICHAQERLALEQKLPADEAIAWHYLDIGVLSRQFHIEHAAADSDAVPLLLGLLAVKPPAVQYAPPEHTLSYRLHRLNRQLVAAGMFMLLPGLLWGAVNLWQSVQLRSASAATTQQAA
jgi:hypothetical protein